jgi:DNA-binding MarR family transcriptional regulator
MNSYQQLFDLIGVLARKRHQAGERRFGAIGLGHSEARLLTLLNEAGGVCGQEALSAKIHLDRSNAGRALKRLEAEGYVSRTVDPSDKRANTVAMTDKGRDAVAAIRSIRNEIAQEFFGAMTEEEAAQVVCALEKALE